ncbi:urea ABC transporter permease subunit UrtB [Sediminimonas qiaohouensis]|uniref:urea ABC transporter permease subunit UrtB n=1 Tax=Sediminimonas qiaohouensis TaxID=552061 RepID=UPI0003FF8273|nr:urea ABC transporter permease subunit UrtB [Sediminimonas qiaohouensis]
MLRFIMLALVCAVLLPVTGRAQDLQKVLQSHHAEVADPGRRTVGVVLDDLLASGLPGVQTFLERWQDKEVAVRVSDGQFFYAEEAEDDTYTLFAIPGAETVRTGVSRDAIEEVKPNGGVRREIRNALVVFQLSDPDIEKRRDAVQAIGRSLKPSHLKSLQAAIPGETDPALKARKTRLAAYLVARYGKVADARIAAIAGLSDDISVETRAVLSQILEARPGVAEALPRDANIARVLEPGSDDLSRAEAYARLVDAGRARAVVNAADIRDALAARIDGARVGGVPVAQLDTQAARVRAYKVLATDGAVPPLVTPAEQARALQEHVFFEVYREVDSRITDAARDAQASVAMRLAAGKAVDLTLDAMSLASIYFLAAIGLAITFGVMGVINMAHGEFIMMGAYTGYLVQLVVPDYTLSLVVALPLAFAVTFGAGVAMERLVIRWLYHRPLETLLATFGISIALQQLAKNIFGTQARPLTSPGWLDGALVINDVIQISYIRIAIFVLALLFLGLLLFVLNRTRLGLEVRAVTQNRGMAASMGINPDRINMLTFGLGSGIAGIAGVAIGLYAKVTSEMGQDYIVQSFMTVVVGGVGNVFGALAGATMIGFFQKGIEWFNPSNTLAAQTYMILFIILFIQVRPKGIMALKGRAAGD